MLFMNKLKRFIGTRDFYKEAIFIAFPVMLQQLISGSVNLIDNVMVGNLGEVATSSVTIANKFFFMFSICVFGVCGAACIFISQYFGANDKYKCRDIFRINLLINTIVTSLFMLVMLLFPSNIISIFTKEQAIIDLGVEYARVAVFTMFPIMVSTTAMSALRAIGQNKVPLFAGITSVVMNSILNYCFIFGNFGFPNWGVKGAAVATVIARVIEMLIYIIYIQKGASVFKWELSRIFSVDFELIICQIKCNT